MLLETSVSEEFRVLDNLLGSDSEQDQLGGLTSLAPRSQGSEDSVQEHTGHILDKYPEAWRVEETIWSRQV